MHARNAMIPTKPIRGQTERFCASSLSTKALRKALCNRFIEAPDI